MSGGDGRGAFSVNTTPDGGAVLQTTISLDREVSDSYWVIVQAADSSRTLRNVVADTEVVVMVTDVNDNAPSFPEFPATTVREGKTIKLLYVI